jgi:PAS domain S-box-containing protein
VGWYPAAAPWFNRLRPPEVGLLRTWSIRTQLAALVLAVAAPLAALHVYDVVRGARLAREAARESGLALARVVARSAQQLLDGRRERVEALAARPLVRDLDPRRCDPFLESVLDLDRTVADVATFDADGRLVCAARGVVAGVSPVGQVPAGPTVLDPRERGAPVAALDAAIVDGAGRRTGTVRLALDLGALSDALAQGDPASGASVVVLDGAGRVVSGTGPARALLGREHPEPALRRLARTADGSAEIGTGDGGTAVVAFAEVPGTPWHVHVVRRERSTADVRALLWRDLAPLGVLLVSVLVLAAAVARRVTVRVEALAATATATERQLRLMERGLAGASFPVTLIRPDGSIAYANDASARAHGCTREELVRTHIFDWDTDYPQERWADAWLGVREAGSVRIQTHHRRVDGTTFPVELHVEHLEFEGEEYAFTFVRDLSERARAEEALRRAQDQFLQAQKMEAIGRLAGGVAHDFNNLLTIILSCAQTLAESFPDDDARKTDAEEIGKAGRTAAALTRQLLAFSRKQPIAPKVLRLGEIVARTERMLRRLIGEDVALELLGADAPWRVRVDPGQLEQVLLNLAVNARDAMPSGGRLTLELTRRQLLGPLLDAGVTVAPGTWVVLRMSDTGTGMDDVARRHAFEPFFSTKPQGQGTGLGLATVYGIVRQASGHVALESAPGRGTTFRIYLPEEEAAPRAVAAAPEPPAAPGAGLTLLVVEDDGPLRAIMARALTAAGYRVLAAASGPEALQVAGRHPGAIDLLVTDVVMPEMNGRQLAERLAALRPATPALFLSGYTDDILGPQGVLAPGIHLLQKPFTPAELVAAVERRLASGGAQRRSAGASSA